MLRWIGRIFIISGLIVLITVGYLLYDFYLGSNYQTKEAHDILMNYGYNDDDIDVNKLLKRKDFEPRIGEVYGT